MSVLTVEQLAELSKWNPPNDAGMFRQFLDTIASRDIEIASLKARAESLDAIVRLQNTERVAINEENQRNYNDMMVQRDAAKLEVERLHKKLVRSLDPTGR